LYLLYVWTGTIRYQGKTLKPVPYGKITASVFSVFLEFFSDDFLTQADPARRGWECPGTILFCQGVSCRYASHPPCARIFYQDYHPGQERLFFKEKVVWNVQKWGECGEKMTEQRKRG
jgi:hypothetical protein